ncbi:sugar O-acyltransferase sialic acid O-acetyltransferase NeuD family [Leptospira noguchii]|uniref:Sugar O-acyltransferase, sialic acid O-acetyltransferase NeuD family n=1 Tax=Leptospira noguchii serovar Autumnalis str. ZUN142 TaxID=1085540 RepID=M6UER6_9LEPT|nr:sugar O-acyltransferase sialic acid O-acetyltransferase NeuD family [Leptospira noguchii]EMO43010.1 sugar O-acyltransferase, sialic acid O-acetyltransferase NeuD family [Leptospira noguchii serovar Autumnalis str. ZUN142]EMS88651.1 sugar O-acyltransferase, sialic acid O-acetyltransferase NeuD family [Leptospira noguchii str. Hook]UOG47567.1 UDP-3-O-(3-hydroxymyristoyl)glucosamine N-acyltransferase [Leptospira noguchii]
MAENEVAFVGWHEGSAGQIHSWFEKAGFGHVAYFIHPENQLPEIRKVKRNVSQFDYPEDGKFKGVPLICDPNWPEFLIQKGITKVLVTIPDSLQRWTEIQKAMNAGLELINAIHPSSLLLNECILGKNIIIHANCTIGYRAEIDDGVIINIGTQIDHHCKIKKSVTIDPGVTMAGNVLIEEFCTIHTRAVIINRIKIGQKSILGAGTVVIQDVDLNSKIVGVPGRNLNKLFQK